VYLDFMHNPRGLEGGFGALSREAYTYLEKSGALFGTPVQRLEKMNRRAIQLYADHGIDLYTERLEIAVCAQHCNGGVAVDDNWKSYIEGLYVAGEAAGTFGVYRPGGSALNSTQVGSLRAAEHIASLDDESVRKNPEYTPPVLKFGTSNIDNIRAELQSKMSLVADFERSTVGMKQLFSKVDALCEDFFKVAVIEDKTQTSELFKLYDMALTQRAVLSAMISSAEAIGTHGSALIDRKPDLNASPRQSRTLTKGAVSHIEKVSPMPNPEIWFETLLAKQREKNDKRKK
jgi:succinate dehydrogenase/fumarate reductase flavoprotein subunit